MLISDYVWSSVEPERAGLAEVDAAPKAWASKEPNQLSSFNYLADPPPTSSVEFRCYCFPGMTIALMMTRAAMLAASSLGSVPKILETRPNVPGAG